MSVQPRNALWNRLLARAEARAKEQSTPESHHYLPRSPGDNHLRASFENSLVYHGLKIETEFNLRLQRPPRKRKTKRKSDLPVAERLRNDRAAAGSPGPTHRTPTGTPARRISKTTPLSRPPIAPVPPLPPLLPIKVTKRAATARERVLNAVSDDDEPPVTGRDPVVQVSDSSDGGLFLARTTRPDGSAVIVFPHFDQAVNSNDTSSWEEDAILVQQPPKGSDSDRDATKKPRTDDVSIPSDMSGALDLRPRYKTSKRDRARRAKARKIASSNSSPEPNSDSGKNKTWKGSADEEERPRQEPGQCMNTTASRNMNVQPTDVQPTARRKNKMSTLKPDEGKANKKNISEERDASKEGDNSGMLCPRDTLLGESLLRRINNLAVTPSENLLPTSVPALSLSSSSDGEQSVPSRRPSPPMRAVVPRRRTPSDISVEDKLFGPLSPLSSPRRRARSISASKECITMPGEDSSAMKVTKRTSPRRRNDRENHEGSVSPKSTTKRQDKVTQKTPLRRSPRGSPQSHEGERRGCTLEVIAAGPTAMKQAAREQENNLKSPNHSGLQKRTVRKSAPRASLSEAWEDASFLDPIDVDSPTNLSKEIQNTKSPPVSSLSGDSEDSDKKNEIEENNQTKRTPSPKKRRVINFPPTDDDSSDDQSRYVTIPRTRKLSSIMPRPSKRKRTVSPSSKNNRIMNKQNKAASLQGKPSSAKAKRIESPREERNSGSSGEVQEICDSDSDVCIVSFSPAKARGKSNSALQKLDGRFVSGRGKGMIASNFEKEEAMKSSSGDSDVSPSTKCKLPLRIRRPILSQSNRREGPKSSTRRTEGTRSRQAGRSLLLSESDEGSGNNERTVRTSPRHKFSIPINKHNMEKRANQKGNFNSPTGQVDGSGSTRTDQVIISSESDMGSGKAIKEMPQTRSRLELQTQIQMSSEARTRRGALLAASDSDGSDSSGHTLLGIYGKTAVVGRKGTSKGRSSARDRQGAKKKRQYDRKSSSREGRCSSGSAAENNDSCIVVDRVLNDKDGLRESSRKKRRRK